MIAPAAERFWAKVTPAAWDECWLWTGAGAATGNGYGRFAADGLHLVGAHRWAYAHLRAEIPAGLVLDHLCGVPACVNPWHLEPVSQSVNVLRGRLVEVSRARYKAQTHCKQGHAFEGNVYPTAKRRTCKICHNLAVKKYEARLRAERVAA